ncbi:Retrovirus-related Pol polyprotein from transposon TNT 1-94 [Vitis vinifera]|uniref:Retrovirus-related Pol polyprotein from transposon TNT 1-94 n=1 Tax=Vitis vinifera TaxID=29760 RepID=A0A438ICC2_VITVI|nr:Retrovirus-related Pol polyprotein from transposon TNT 1-94 [Vitis vinifera]
MLGLVASMNLEIEQLNVKTAFLHGDLEEEIYMEQLEGFIIKGKERLKFFDGEFIILLLYVDDMLIVGHDTSKIDKLKKELSKSFQMKDLRPTSQILGIKISRDKTNGKLCLSQESYIEKVLDKLNMGKAKLMSSSLGTVGSLMYAMVCTRPDIAHAVRVVSRFLSNPGKEHYAAVKWILKYLRGTSKTVYVLGLTNLESNVMAIKIVEMCCFIDHRV